MVQIVVQVALEIADQDVPAVVLLDVLAVLVLVKVLVHQVADLIVPEVVRVIVVLDV